MIIAQNLSIDPPGNEKEFERWCLWLAREKYGPDVFLYSRKKQFGIDIYWLKHGKYFVIQCKQRTEPDPAELIRHLEADFALAQNHFGANLEQFIFASTITLEQASQKVQRGHGHTECLLDAVGRLEAAHNVATVCWHWDGIAKDVADSPFLEDWYQHVENSQLQKEAVELLIKASKTSHVRLVIGDRPAKPGAKKAYESQISSATIFELDAGENVALLDVIFKKMPAWKAKASEEQIKEYRPRHLVSTAFYLPICRGSVRNGGKTLTNAYETGPKQTTKIPVHRG